MTLASIHDHCGQLHDPDRGQPCPCNAITAHQVGQARRRHRDAVARAKLTDEAAEHLRRYRNRRIVA